MEKVKLKYLLRRFRDKTISEEELSVLQAYIRDACPEKETLLSTVMDELAEEDYDETISIRSGKMFSAISSSILPAASPDETDRQPRKRYPLYWMGAAAVLLVSMGLILLWHKGDTSAESTGADTKGLVIQPGSPKAKVVLEDGSHLDLETLKNDTTVVLNGYNITKTVDGELLYTVHETSTPEDIVYNTIITPKGGEYKLSLPDSTRVWVNASSELRYPLNIGQSSREVTLEGEAFFEVRKKTVDGKDLPFVVHTGNQRLEVLGTVFNVNNHVNSIQTTLVEGAVKLSFDGEHVTYLKPNEQANYKEDENTLEIKEIDPFYTIAWKNGTFAFDDAPLHVVMESLARWYDVSIDYLAEVKNKRFTGTISRYEQIDNVLKLIEMTGSVKFDIKERRVIVKE